LAGVGIALTFAAYTQHAWEDYYITFRSAKNLARGFGLVFQPGERVHAFTSPIGVLLPAALSWIVRNSADDLVLWLFRCISASLFVFTGMAIVRGQRTARVLPGVSLFTLALVATDAKIVDFSINGQESAFLVMGLCVSWACLAESRRSSLRLAAAWALLQYARPDGFVYGLAIAVGVWIFVDRGRQERRERLMQYARAAAVALAVYAPWLLWTWFYYGTPVPHTIVAKQVYAPHQSVGALLRACLEFPLHVSQASAVIFEPIYSFWGGWPGIVPKSATVLGTVLSCYWLVPRASGHGRALSFAFCASAFYLTQVIAPSPWYLPAAAVIGLVAAGFLLQDLVRMTLVLKTRSAPLLAGLVRVVSVAAAGAVLAFTIAMLLASAQQLRIQQREIEWGTRKPIGVWLRRHMQPGDRVFLEPLGYIGFYSGRKMLDFPGLASPEVVAARRELRSSTWADLVDYLDPEWLVLRARELGKVFNERADLQQQYQLVAQFEADERLRDYGWIPGSGYLQYDSSFFIYRRDDVVLR